MPSDASEQKHVQMWFDDLNLGYREGGVEGPSLGWALSLSFGGSTHVSVAHDTRHPRRLEVISDLAIADDHRQKYARWSKEERAALDRKLVTALLRRSSISFQIARDADGAPEKIAMRAYLPVDGLTPHALALTIYDARNTTMDLCVTFQDAMGESRSIDRGFTDAGYANVILQKGTLETLDAFQIPGETLDETILRAVRE